MVHLLTVVYLRFSKQFDWKQWQFLQKIIKVSKWLNLIDQGALLHLIRAPQFLLQSWSCLIIPRSCQKINRGYAKEKKYYVSTPPCPSTQQLLPCDQQACSPIIKNNKWGRGSGPSRSKYIHHFQQICLYTAVCWSTHCISYCKISKHSAPRDCNFCFK